MVNEQSLMMVMAGKGGQWLVLIVKNDGQQCFIMVNGGQSWLNMSHNREDFQQ